MANTDTAWKKWGERDPYYGVLSDQKFSRENLDVHRDEFFATGVEIIGRRLRIAKDQLGLEHHRRALDFGCGVGRLALALGPHFDEVTGLDISPAMIAEAERNARAAGQSNVRFALSDETLSAATGAFDFVHTYIVLQHIPVKRGLRLADQLLDRVAPGGVASLHVSVARQDGVLLAGAYWLRKNIPGVDAVVSLARTGRYNGPMMQMNDYPLPYLLRAFLQKGFGQVLVDSEFHGNRLTVHLSAKRLTAA